MARPINDNGLALTQRCEGLVLMVYRDVVGIQTAGWGHVIRPADGDLRLGDTITREQADRWLQDDLATAMLAVDRYAPDLTADNQRAALCDFAYNLGGSNLRQLVEDADGVPATIAEHFAHWTRAGHMHPRGLRIRRALEADLFRQPDGIPLPTKWLTLHDGIA